MQTLGGVDVQVLPALRAKLGGTPESAARQLQVAFCSSAGHQPPLRLPLPVGNGSWMASTCPVTCWGPAAAEAAHCRNTFGVSSHVLPACDVKRRGQDMLAVQGA